MVPHRGIIARWSLGIGGKLLWMNSVLEGIYMLNRTFWVGQGIRVSQERCPNPLFTNELLLGPCSEVAELLRRCLGQGRWSPREEETAGRVDFHSAMESTLQCLAVTTSGKDAANQPSQHLELCQETRPGSPHPSCTLGPAAALSGSC